MIMSHIVTIQLLYGPTLSLYSYCTVPSLYCSVAVRWRRGTINRLQPAKKNVRQRLSPYSSCMLNTWDHTAAVRRHRQSYFTYSTSQSWFNCCEDAEDSLMLLSSWCPFKMKKGKWLSRQFKIIYQLVPLSTLVSCHWTVPFIIHMNKGTQQIFFPMYSMCRLIKSTSIIKLYRQHIVSCYSYFFKTFSTHI